MMNGSENDNQGNIDSRTYVFWKATKYLELQAVRIPLFVRSDHEVNWPHSWVASVNFSFFSAWAAH